MSLEQLVQHAAEAEPVGTRVVRRPLGEHLRRHVAVRADRRVRLLLAEIAGQPEVRDAHVAVLVQQDVGRLQVPVHDEALVHVVEAQDDLDGRRRENMVINSVAIVGENLNGTRFR